MAFTRPFICKGLHHLISKFKQVVQDGKDGKAGADVGESKGDSKEKEEKKAKLRRGSVSSSTVLPSGPAIATGAAAPAAAVAAAHAAAHQLSPQAAAASLAVIGKYSKQFLPLFFNLADKTADDKRGAVDLVLFVLCLLRARERQCSVY